VTYLARFGGKFGYRNGRIIISNTVIKQLIDNVIEVFRYKTQLVLIIMNDQISAFSSKLLKAFTEVTEEFESIVGKYCDD